jgi:hypothetical protein
VKNTMPDKTANQLPQRKDHVEEFAPLTGRCHCGSLSYSVSGEPEGQGICYCRDCQRISGSGFLPWLFVSASFLTLVGSSQVKHVCGISSTGTEKVVSCCTECGSCVFGGRYGIDKNHTIYAGTLDDDCVARFSPKIAMFVKDRPAWATLQVGLKEFERMPGSS